MWPQSGRRYETADARLADLRLLRLRGFPVILYYRVVPDAIMILATFHASRGRIYIEQMLTDG